MANQGNIFLIGPMGAGKTTVGRQVARRLKLEFFDSDKEIEALCGVNIPTIFEYEGETGFRDRETRMIEGLTLKNPIVLATGGGAVLRAENRKVLTSRGFVVYLQVSLKEQFNRISHDKNRPLLQTPNPRQTLRKIMEERAPIYESMADLRVTSNGRNMRYVVDRITKYLKNNQ